MPLLAIEGAVYDVAGVGQRGRKLPVEIRIVFNNEKAQTTLRLTLADDRALDGVHNDAGDFAIMTEHCQHIGEAFAAMAQARAHQCTRHARTHGAQGCGKMQHSTLLDQRPALLWVEADARRGIGGVRRLRRRNLLGSLLRTRSSACEGERQQHYGGYGLTHAVLQTAVNNLLRRIASQPRCERLAKPKPDRQDWPVKELRPLLQTKL
jgi:hypothetical protein